MNSRLASEVIALGGNPTDSVWRWLLLQGPHGSAFTWGQSRHEPPGYVSLDHLRQVIEKRQADDAKFPDRVIQAARACLGSSDAEIVQRGIQVIAVVGEASDLKAVMALAKSGNPKVAGDARACAFELRRSIRRKSDNKVL